MNNITKIKILKYVLSVIGIYFFAISILLIFFSFHVHNYIRWDAYNEGFLGLSGLLFLSLGIGSFLSSLDVIRNILFVKVLIIFTGLFFPFFWYHAFGQESVSKNMWLFFGINGVFFFTLYGLYPTIEKRKRIDIDTLVAETRVEELN